MYRNCKYVTKSILKYLIFSCCCKLHLKFSISNCSFLVYRNKIFYLLLCCLSILIVVFFLSLWIFYLDIIMSSVKKMVFIFPFQSICFFFSCLHAWLGPPLQCSIEVVRVEILAWHPILEGIIPSFTI